MAACKWCEGKGTYMVKETYTDGDTVLVAHECNHCQGTGEDQETDGSGDFDLGVDDED